MFLHDLFFHSLSSYVLLINLSLFSTLPSRFYNVFNCQHAHSFPNIFLSFCCVTSLFSFYVQSINMLTLFPLPHEWSDKGLCHLWINKTGLQATYRTISWVWGCNIVITRTCKSLITCMDIFELCGQKCFSTCGKPDMKGAQLPTFLNSVFLIWSFLRCFSNDFQYFLLC